MTTRKYPLFIIDDSRSHGRGRETDFLACTSKELPWIGQITLINEKELSIDQDWSQKNPMCLYSEPRGGIRAKLKVVSTPVIIWNNNRSELQSLMRRCMKEYLVRHAVVEVDSNDISNEAVSKFAGTMLGQIYETLRENPNDSQARIVAGILTRVKRDYKNDNKKG